MSNEEWLAQRREWEIMIYDRPWTWQKVSKLTVLNYRPRRRLTESPR